MTVNGCARAVARYLKPSINSSGRGREISFDFSNPLYQLPSFAGPLPVLDGDGGGQDTRERALHRERAAARHRRHSRMTPETQIHIIPSARALCNRLKRIDVTIDSGDGYRGTDTRRSSPLIESLEIAWNKTDPKRNGNI